MNGWIAGYYNLFGEHEDGCVKRTVEVNERMNVDLDGEDRIIGVEILGADPSQDCGAALVSLAMQGRLKVS